MPLVSFNFGPVAMVTIDEVSGAVTCTCRCSCETQHHSGEPIIAQSDGEGCLTHEVKACGPVLHRPDLTIFSDDLLPCLFTRTATRMFMSRHYNNPSPA